MAGHSLQERDIPADVLPGQLLLAVDEDDDAAHDDQHAVRSKRRASRESRFAQIQFDRSEFSRRDRNGDHSARRVQLSGTPAARGTVLLYKYCTALWPTKFAY